MIWPAASLLVALAAAALLLRGRFAAMVLDQPNERSLHTTPVPRTGGLAILAGLAVAAPAWAGPLLPALALALALGAASFLDDRRGLPVALRFAIHLAAAAALVGWGGAPAPGLAAGLAALLAIAWMTNLYNFMDGSDGLAGGMAVIGFSAYAAAAWIAGDTSLLLPALCVAAAAAGFLAFNFHPARLFMGDAGSIPLGFLAGAMGFAGWSGGTWPAWFPLVVFSPFVVDASVTLARRLLRGERIWQAHREHYYQRLVRGGLGHRATALAEYAVMILVALAGLLALSLGQTLRLATLAAVGAGYILLMRAIDRRWAAASPPQKGH